jgi:hypothetical protein
MRLYLAGPMTSIPQFNFPEFDRWAKDLRSAGFDVISPHESDDEDVQAAAWRSKSGNMLDLPPSKEGSDRKLTMLKNTTDILSCEGMALLPGWNRSPGSIHEIAIATRLQIPVAPVQMWLELGNDKCDWLF